MHDPTNAKLSERRTVKGVWVNQTCSRLWTPIILTYSYHTRLKWAQAVNHVRSKLRNISIHREEPCHINFMHVWMTILCSYRSLSLSLLLSLYKNINIYIYVCVRVSLYVSMQLFNYIRILVCMSMWHIHANTMTWLQQTQIQWVIICNYHSQWMDWARVQQAVALQLCASYFICVNLHSCSPPSSNQLASLILTRPGKLRNVDMPTKFWSEDSLHPTSHMFTLSLPM